MNEWLSAHPTAVAGLILWASGILWLMPGSRPSAPRPRIPGLILAAAGLVAFCFASGPIAGEFADEAMFWLFGICALMSGVLMITAGNPVYAALWFALATLATCGLFLLQQAPFLAAATVIVYAGAVIVTFLFVIMLAQQSGAAAYDQKAMQPRVAVVSAFVLLAALTKTVQMSPLSSTQDEMSVTAAEDTQASLPAGESMQPADLSVKVLNPESLRVLPPQAGNLLSQATSDHPVGSMKGLGRSLFGDYLFAVEIAGTLLLIASIGAVAVAPRREQGAL